MNNHDYDNCIDLSVGYNILGGIHGHRLAIYDYRKDVLAHMTLMRESGLSPWKQVKGHNFHFTLSSTFNNRHVDQLFCAAIDKQLRSVPYNMTDSLSFRHRWRNTAHHDFYAHGVNLLGANNKHNLQGFTVCVMPMPEGDLRYILNNKNDVDLSRELNLAANETSVRNHFIAPLREKIAQCRSTIAADQLIRMENVIEIHFDEMIMESLPNVGSVEQSIFIDLKTLAALSHGKTESCFYPVRNAWSDFAVRANISNFPVSALNDSLDKGGAISAFSPHGSSSDPISETVMAMWALGAADEFSIDLNLDHPDKSKRGVVMKFAFGGKGNSALLETEKTAHHNLRHDSMLDDPRAPKPRVNPILESFRKALSGSGEKTP